LHQWVFAVDQPVASVVDESEVFPVAVGEQPLEVLTYPVLIVHQADDQAIILGRIG